MHEVYVILCCLYFPESRISDDTVVNLWGHLTLILQTAPDHPILIDKALKTLWVRLMHLTHVYG